MRVLLTRPRADSETLARRLGQAGIDSLIAPMLEIVPRAKIALDLDRVQALLVTSVNGARALSDHPDAHALPLFAVGQASADAAREAGFGKVTTADGDVADLAGLVARRLDPAAGALLHVGGAELAGDLGGALAASGFDYRRVVLYDAKPATALAPEVLAALVACRIDAVMFFSPRSARQFVQLTAILDRSWARPVSAYCLSAAVAKACAGPDWRRIMVAPRPAAEPLIARVLADAASERNPTESERP